MTIARVRPPMFPAHFIREGVDALSIALPRSPGDRLANSHINAAFGEMDAGDPASVLGHGAQDLFRGRRPSAIASMGLPVKHYIIVGLISLHFKCISVR